MGIVDRLRNGEQRLAQEAADMIEELAMALAQYRDDLNYPPTKDSLARRIEMIKSLLARV